MSEADVRIGTDPTLPDQGDRMCRRLIQLIGKLKREFFAKRAAKKRPK